jgi:hypothetical protein
MMGMSTFLSRQSDFGPEGIQMLASALERAWASIEKSGNRLARPGYARAVREVIARRIIETAQRGVKDPNALAEDAIQFFVVNYNGGRAA